MTHAAPKRKAAGNFETTTATTNNFKRILALYARIKGLFVHFACWVIVIFGGII